MAIPKGKTDAGQGGKRGHSNMAHWVFSHELKEAARKGRRLDAKRDVREGIAEREGLPLKLRRKRPKPSRTPLAARNPESARVRAYLAALVPGTRRIVQRIRRDILSAARGGVDGFSYGIPSVIRNGKTVVWYAGRKQHVTLYPIPADITRDMAGQLAPAEISKGMIRFPLDSPPSSALVRRLVRRRLALA